MPEVRVRLPEPYDRPWMEWYLSAHAVPGVARWDERGYAGAVTAAAGPDLLSLRFEGPDVLVGMRRGPVEAYLPSVRRLLDLDTDVAAVDAHLAADPALAPDIAAAPGLRVPGTLDGWELLLRTMVGQQISLAAARTHLGRLAAALGEALAGVDDGSWRLMPTAVAVADGGGAVLTGPRRRVESVVAAARVVADGALDLSPGRDPVALRADLLALPGVGAWTADYVVMRLAPHRDVLLASDLVVRQGADRLGVDLRDSSRTSGWAPYRSYATMHLWHVALAARAGVTARSAGGSSTGDGS